MVQVREGDSAEFIDEEDIDTIELELRPEDLARLTRAFGSAEGPPNQVELTTHLGPDAGEAPKSASHVSAIQEAPVQKAPVQGAPVQEAPVRGTAVQGALSDGGGTHAVASAEASRRLQWRWVALSGVVTLAAGLIWLVSVDAFRAKDPPARLATAPTEIKSASIPISPPPMEPPPPPQGEVVKFRNPFDATEVFEFPPGTSAIEARDAVAEFLLQRARERRGAPVETNRGRAKDLRREARTAADLVDSPRDNP